MIVDAAGDATENASTPIGMQAYPWLVEAVSSKHWMRPATTLDQPAIHGVRTFVTPQRFEPIFFKFEILVFHVSFIFPTYSARAARNGRDLSRPPSRETGDSFKTDGTTTDPDRGVGSDNFDPIDVLARSDDPQRVRRSSGEELLAAVPSSKTGV
jgi:hypothetical protein